MRRWIRVIILGATFTALALPSAYARGSARSAGVPVAAANGLGLTTKPLGYQYQWIGSGVMAGVGSPAPVTPAAGLPVAKRPLCHEVTPAGVVVERGRACSPAPR
jgi:hypothetical protein